MSQDTAPRAKRSRHTPAHGRLARLSKDRGPDDPAVVELRQQVAEIKAERIIRDVVAAAPPLSAETRQRLAEILAPTTGTGAA